VVPFARAGRVEAVARILTDALSKDLGQPFLVESRAGAGGSIGADYVAKAAPDGHILLLAPAGRARHPAQRRQEAALRPGEGFTPDRAIIEGFTYIGANPGVPAKTIGELVALAKEKPGTIGYASSGIGNLQPSGRRAVQHRRRADQAHPLRGSGPALNDIVAGHVPLMIGGELGDLGKAGKIRILATTNEKRSPDFPDVPTMKESGFPQFIAPFLDGAVRAGGSRQGHRGEDFRQASPRRWPIGDAGEAARARRRAGLYAGR
jgi:tripartite-type tricarboxylate transporter receptor subunit TctC